MNALCITISLVTFLPAAFAQDNYAWENSALNTAKNANYMQQDEKDMIYEINRLRSNPPRYAKMFVAVRLKNAVEVYKTYGKGDSNYSISTFYQNNNVTSVDTNWHFSNEEDMRALQTLYDTLMHLKPLSILLPDEGIYKVCIKHAKTVRLPVHLDI